MEGTKLSLADLEDQEESLPDIQHQREEQPLPAAIAAYHPLIDSNDDHRSNADANLEEYTVSTK